MTKTQFRKNYNHLINEPDGLRKFLQTKMEQFLKSGAIELSGFDNDYEAPKAVLCAVLKEATRQYYPFSDRGEDLIIHLERF